MKNITVDIKDQILKPVIEVFEAIVDPEKIAQYFASRASGRMISGQKVVWEFKDVGVELEIQVISVETGKSIVFDWTGSGQLARVTILVQAENSDQTIIKITEADFEPTEEGIKKALQQTRGWTDFICSLKAWMYTGINLRNGRTRIIGQNDID